MPVYLGGKTIFKRQQQQLLRVGDQPEKPFIAIYQDGGYSREMPKFSRKWAFLAVLPPVSIHSIIITPSSSSFLSSNLWANAEEFLNQPKKRAHITAVLTATAMYTIVGWITVKKSKNTFLDNSGHF
jgi:hypothetical protein